jgi:uncharacterized protein YidB (DUF937 family)
MDLTNILQQGAQLIQNNSDDATTGLDLNDITGALGNLLGGSDGNLNLAALAGNLANNGGLGDIVNSWLGSGQNSAIDADQVSNLLGSDKVSEFASNLGISQESAQQALSDALPQIVDKASTEGNMIENIFDQIGGTKGAMDMLGKFFG